MIFMKNPLRRFMNRLCICLWFMVYAFMRLCVYAFMGGALSLPKYGFMGLWVYRFMVQPYNTITFLPIHASSVLSLR